MPQHKRSPLLYGTTKDRRSAAPLSAAPLGERNPMQEAADAAGVSFAEFKLWMLENVPATPVRWSNWNHGKEPIPAKYVIQFLREKIDRLNREAGA